MTDTFDFQRHLELLLNSEIATTTNLTMLRRFVKKPTEETWTYRKLDEPFPTDLYQAMKTKFGNIKALAPIFRFALDATSKLGRWCADQVWAQALADEVLPKLEGIVSRDCNFESQKQTAEETQYDITKAKEAYEIVSAHEHKQPLGPGQLSPKVELFLDCLRKHFRESRDKKCIVFTKRRNTAKTLLRLCETLEIPNLRPGILVGVRSSDITGSITFRHQFLVLVKFRQGDINCLVSSSRYSKRSLLKALTQFATSVAEEGLDIPDCNLVVRYAIENIYVFHTAKKRRFDLYDTVIQYVQSRGRARHANSIASTPLLRCTESTLTMTFSMQA